MRFGQSRMEYDNGDAYDGEWDRVCMNGQGTFSKKNERGDILIMKKVIANS